MSDSMDNNIPLRKRLSPCVPLRFPGFEKHYEAGHTAVAYAFDRLDCRQWYREMVDKIIGAIGKNEYLPLYRMCDGEYKFALKGYREEKSQFWERSLHKIAVELWHWLNGRHAYHRSGSREYGFELYTKEEHAKAYRRFVEDLREIAECGLLTFCLHDRPLAEDYLPEILNWLDDEDISTHRQNYYHHYSVYVLMHGPDRHKLLQGRRILVVTGLTEAKRDGIEKGLHREGAKDVQFLPISLNKAMFDVLDLSLIEEPVDLVLIGAGIGAVNILVQLRPLQTVCLDVGFALNTLANPDLRWNRPFCVPDEEFDVNNARW